MSRSVGVHPHDNAAEIGHRRVTGAALDYAVHSAEDSAGRKDHAALFRGSAVAGVRVGGFGDGSALAGNGRRRAPGEEHSRQIGYRRAAKHAGDGPEERRRLRDADRQRAKDQGDAAFQRRAGSGRREGVRPRE